MDIIITPHKLHGTIPAIPSKSDAHRALIAAAFADAKTTIAPVGDADDIKATIRCLRALGVEIEVDGSTAYVTPFTGQRGKNGNEGASIPVLDCGESGSTLRILLPVAAMRFPQVTFVGRGRLPERSIAPLVTEMKRHGFSFSSDTLPFTVTHPTIASDGQNGSDARSDGKTIAAKKDAPYILPGDVSSQFVSGLMMAGVPKILLTSPLASAGYVQMTQRTLLHFCIRYEKQDDGWVLVRQAMQPEDGTEHATDAGQIISPITHHTPERYTVEGDWSAAAAFVAMGVAVTGLCEDSLQKDRAIKEMDWSKETFDVTHTPDLVPVMVARLAATPGAHRIFGAARLRDKESDRLKATAAMIRALGGEVTETEDGLVVIGRTELDGGRVETAGDHRIAFAAAVASTFCKGPVTVCGAECVAKSYPGFWEDFRAAGGQYEVLP